MLPRLLKSYSYNSKSLTRFTLFNCAQAVQNSQIVNKFTVTRRPSEKYALYVDTQITVEEFKKKVQSLFPNCKIGISNKIQYFMNIGSTFDQQYQKQYMETFKDFPFIDALILNKVVIYQKGQNNQASLIFGIQINEYNLIDKINIPEHIEEGIVQVNGQWSGGQLTLKQALDFSTIRKWQDGNLNNQSGKQIQRSILPEEQQALKQSLLQLIYIKKFDEKIGPYLPRTNKLMARILAMMSVNGVFLFYLTYGYRGWDFGQPVSYLTGLMVQLIAMMGFFEANEALTTQREKDKKYIEAILNMRANQNMAKWRIAYLSRKIKL